MSGGEGVQVEARRAWERDVLVSFLNDAPANGEVADYVAALSTSMLLVRAADVIGERDRLLAAKDAEIAHEVQRRKDVTDEFRRQLDARDRLESRLRAEIESLRAADATERSPS